MFQFNCYQLNETISKYIQRLIYKNKKKNSYCIKCLTGFYQNLKFCSEKLLRIHTGFISYFVIVNILLNSS